MGVTQIDTVQLIQSHTRQEEVAGSLRSHEACVETMHTFRNCVQAGPLLASDILADAQVRAQQEPKSQKLEAIGSGIATTIAIIVTCHGFGLANSA